MQINVKGKNLEVTERLRTYIEKKMVKFDRLMPHIDEAKVEMAVHETKSAEDRHVVQFTLRSGGTILRAEERSSDMQTSIDAVMDKMSRQVERYKGKRYRSQGRPQTEAAIAATVEEVETESEGEVVRTKRFQTRPMSVEEAIVQMELLGHDFFAFYNAADSAFNVIYRRRDGGYGLLIPELA